jgi:hypothetical protein
MPRSQPFGAWLAVQLRGSPEARYIHCLLRENLDERPAALGALRAYVYAAHEDALRLLRDLASPRLSLDPLLEEDAEPEDDTMGYPERLPIQTLKGYFGEIFAGLLAEHFAPFGEERWVVPAHLFRFHKVAFQYLESVRQTGRTLASLPGRTGDDCLAFQLDAAGRIAKVLYCEAKCTRSHDSELIRDAHEKVGSSAITDLLQLIEILQGRDDEEARRWVRALRLLHMRPGAAAFERFDLVSYVCSQFPKREPSWMPLDRPHSSYQGGRWLQAVEIYIHDVEALIREVYAPATPAQKGEAHVG